MLEIALTCTNATLSADAEGTLRRLMAAAIERRAVDLRLGYAAETGASVQLVAYLNGERPKLEEVLTGSGDTGNLRGVIDLK